MSGYGITSPFPTIDTVLPARNRRVGGGSRVTWFSGSAPGAAERCWGGAARDPEQKRKSGRIDPHRVAATGKAPEALPRTVRTVDADRLERSCRRSSTPTGMYTHPMRNRPNAHEALLGATSELTYARGITGTGVDAIAAQAGVTKRTLYQHFG